MDPITEPLSTNGILGYLNVQQQQSLDALKEKLAESEYADQIEKNKDGDKFVLRFLRKEAKDKKKKGAPLFFQTEKAYQAITTTLEWRKNNGAHEFAQMIEDELELDRYEEYKAIRPRHYVSCDSTGQLFIFERFGLLCTHVDPKHFTDQEWERFFSYETELIFKTLREKSEQFGFEISTISTVIDLKGQGFGMRSRIPWLKLMGNVNGEHFPELLQTVYLVNAGFFFWAMWSLVKPFLDSDTASKLVIERGYPVEEWKKRGVDVSVFPKEYGGERDVEVPTTAHHKA